MTLITQVRILTTSGHQWWLQFTNPNKSLVLYYTQFAGINQSMLENENKKRSLLGAHTSRL